ncbi:winged helix DNA-binding domain-containing protein [Streptomyces sp. WAC06614]|uniref:winged helix DNA-binding domain-containing protein n=1 Tax=Streptomyces sp. WAC06614 TaxID=2487416 RepID=UPI000F7B6CE9|nr:winged helix DNA-binding domain-containing protein [Streptomyces sp. WAC06614]RSS56241.1 winged helix DNA-binding domain-containing protein [Streptomyces sp. WAC06614]
MAFRSSPVVLGARALSRATLARQMLLSREGGMSARDAVGHLVGLQAQNVKPPYFQLHARLAGFRPAELAGLMERREVVRMVTLRSTIHLHTAEDARALRGLVQGARDREVQQFRKGLVGVDLGRLEEVARGVVEEAPRTMAELREALVAEWPEADPQALGVAARCRLPLVQVTPRGVWGRSGQVRLTTWEQWVGAGHSDSEGAARCDMEGVVLRYLRAFGPASVKDMQTWAGLTRLKEVFERLRPELLVFRDEKGVELFDVPEAPRPDGGTPAPPRFLPEFDNVLLSHADRSRIVPAELKGRTWKGNQAYCTLLVDGFLGGIWKFAEASGGGRDEARVVVELFREVSAAQRAEIVHEGESMLAAMTDAARFSVEFGPIGG